MTPSRADPSRRWSTHAALLLVQVCFASGAVEGKLAMAPADGGGGDVEPLALAMARMVSASLFFQGLTLFRSRRAPRPTRRDLLVMAGLSLLGVVLNQGLYLVGLRMTSPFTAALIGSSIPVFTAALAIVFRQERATWRTGIGLSLAVAGVVWLTGIRSIDEGAIVVALNCLAYSLYLVLGKRVIQRLGALTLMAWLFTFGAMIFAPLGMPALVRGAATWTPRAWLLVGYVVLLPTIVAYVANAWALGRSSASLVTIYIYLQPLITAILNYVQLGQGLNERMIVASGFIVVGVAVVSSRRAIEIRAGAD